MQKVMVLPSREACGLVGLPFFGRDSLFSRCLMGGSKHECLTERRYNLEPFAVLPPKALIPSKVSRAKNYNIQG